MKNFRTIYGGKFDFQRRFYAAKHVYIGAQEQCVQIIDLTIPMRARIFPRKIPLRINEGPMLRIIAPRRGVIRHEKGGEINRVSIVMAKLPLDVEFFRIRMALIDDAGFVLHKRHGEVDLSARHGGQPDAVQQLQRRQKIQINPKNDIILAEFPRHNVHYGEFRRRHGQGVSDTDPAQSCACK